jgi:hypothetical protein
MPTLSSFQLVAARWHDFFLLTGGAAATLSGLMFVAVTFGAGLVSGQSAASPRAFIDPTLSHFVQVLGTACFFVMPTVTPRFVGAALVIGMVARAFSLAWVLKHMRLAQKARGDLELGDWLSGIIFPVIAFTIIAIGGLAFLVGGADDAAFTTVAIGTTAVLALGLHSAWELMIWMAVATSRKKD